VPPGNLSTVTAEFGSNIAGAFIDTAPLDLDLQSGGVAGFDRLYYGGTALTATAPQEVDGRAFVKWLVNGAPHPSGVATIGVTISGNTMLQAVYALDFEVAPQRALSHPTERIAPSRAAP
jgi:hypothetical protein